LHLVSAFVAGVPLGLLGALALGRGSWLGVELGTAAGGLLLVLAVAVAARFAAPDTERAHLGRAALVGLAALPAAAAAWLGLLPGPVWAFGAVLLALAVCFALALRATGPGGGALRLLAVAGVVLALGSAAALGAAGLLAAFTAHPFARPTEEQRAKYVYDIDAGVALGPDPGCSAATPAGSRELAVGAAPSLGEAGAVVWFDAPGPDGRRQIHRLERASGAVRCWTCGEPGNNRRPRLAPSGASLVFESDRHASPFEPVNWELYLVGTRGEAPKGSRRLTYDPGPDLFGSLDPGGRLLVWSSPSSGRYAVASAALRSGHGGLLLGSPSLLVDGGAAWVAPLAWSPDARTLAVLRGDPLGLQHAIALDPATGREAPLSPPGAAVAAASFSGDGALLAVATTRPAAATAAVPASLGFLTARLAALGSGEETRFRGTGVRLGAPWSGELSELALDEIASWGHPTGIALEPDGRAFVLGQRRTGEAGAEERLLRVELACPRLP
jgi:hypothetical protein